MSLITKMRRRGNKGGPRRGQKSKEGESYEGNK
jgi:hypothetical protein